MLGAEAGTVFLAVAKAYSCSAKMAVMRHRKCLSLLNRWCEIIVLMEKKLSRKTITEVSKVIIKKPIYSA